MLRRDRHGGFGERPGERTRSNPSTAPQADSTTMAVSFVEDTGARTPSGLAEAHRDLQPPADVRASHCPALTLNRLTSGRVFLRRAPCRATRFVSPSPEASRPELNDLDSRV